MQLEDITFLTINCFISVAILGYPQLMQSVLIKLIFFDIFYTEHWMPSMMKGIGLDFDRIENDDPMNLQFSENGFGSKQFLVNIGSTLLFIVGYLALWLLLLLLSRIQSFWPLILRMKEAL